jgi:hypothetical protein
MVPTERDEERSLRHLIAIYEFLSKDNSLLKGVVERAGDLRAQAFAAQRDVVMSLGPINLFAAFGRVA